MMKKEVLADYADKRFSQIFTDGPQIFTDKKN